jgi:hypothetical protein
MSMWSKTGARPSGIEDAEQEVLAAERRLAEADGGEFVEVIEWPAPWETGAPLPHVFASERRVVLVYLVADPDPGWDGRSVRVVDPAGPQVEKLAIVSFGSADVRFGSPNDEVLHGHPLWGRGLSMYAAHVVRNSRWLAEIERINAVHREYDPSRWRSRKHYLLCFHDSTFECLAEGFDVEVVHDTWSHVLELAFRRVTEDGEGE